MPAQVLPGEYSTEQRGDLIYEVLPFIVKYGDSHQKDAELNILLAAKHSPNEMNVQSGQTGDNFARERELGELIDALVAWRDKGGRLPY